MTIQLIVKPLCFLQKFLTSFFLFISICLVGQTEAKVNIATLHFDTELRFRSSFVEKQSFQLDVDRFGTNSVLITLLFTESSFFRVSYSLKGTLKMVFGLHRLWECLPFKNPIFTIYDYWAEKEVKKTDLIFQMTNISRVAWPFMGQQLVIKSELKIVLASSFSLV